MQVINLGENNSVLNSYIAQMRDIRIQKDSQRFRINLERTGEIFAYEISKKLEYSEKDVTTPLGIASVSTPDTPVVAAAILRAGLPIHQGILRVFDSAETAFIAAYRKYGKGDYFKIRPGYCTTPSLEGKTLILADAMAATGSSFEVGLQKIMEEGGQPACIHLVCPLVSRYALDQMSQKYTDEVTLWVAAIDEELTVHNFIIPGLGDAGDLAYGSKL